MLLPAMLKVAMFLHLKANQLAMQVARRDSGTYSQCSIAFATCFAVSVLISLLAMLSEMMDLLDNRHEQIRFKWI